MKEYFKKLMSNSSNESSKRFAALYIVLIIGTIITAFAIPTGTDLILLLATWLTFAGALWGMSEYNKNVKTRCNTEKEEVENTNVIKEEDR